MSSIQKTFIISEVRACWGIYVIVLENEGCVPRIYIASGTNVRDRGVFCRLKAYGQASYLSPPKYVSAELEDGSKVISNGVIVHAPIPSAMNVPSFRLLFLAMEATLSVFDSEAARIE